DNLIFFYDDNHITIDGKTELAFSEDVGKRYEAYGWAVQHIDGHDRKQIQAALDKAVAERGRPSLIVARTHIGIGSPKQDSEKGHDEAGGADAVKKTKQHFGGPEEKTFYVPDEVYAVFKERAKDGDKEHAAWSERVGQLKKNPDAWGLYEKIMRRHVPP